MGVTGPVPKRDGERRRRNKPDTPTETVPVSGEVPVPAADPAWHPIARDWYASLAGSGQAQFYEPSDWATACYTAHVMSEILNADTLSAALIGAVNTLMSSLLTTEGDRRRVRMEIDRKTTGKPKLAPVTVMDTYRDAFSG
jgi:hypothetical protein